MDDLIWRRRQAFDEMVRTSRYEEGQKTILGWLEDDRNGLVYWEKSDRYWEAWGMLQRLRFIGGSKRKFFEALDEEGISLSAAGCAEYELSTAYADYHRGDYRLATRKGMALFQRLQAVGPEADYLRMRLMFVIAKCSWRRDDFPLALRRLGLATEYYNQYSSSRPMDYNDYFKGRLLTVYIRLLTERRGDSGSGLSNVELAGKLLEAAKNYFSNECVLEGTKGNAGSHLYLVELHELRSMMYRNEAEKGGMFLEKYTAASKEIDQAESMLHKESATNKKTRRFAHLLRLRGELLLREVILKGRKGKRKPPDQDKCHQAVHFFTEELILRKAIFFNQIDAKAHATIARVQSNLSLANNLLGHGFINYEGHVDYDKALDNFTAGREYALQALKENGLDYLDPRQMVTAGKAKAWHRTLKATKVLSLTEALQSFGLLMEATLRQRKLEERPPQEIYDEILVPFRAACIAENQKLLRMQSTSAREEVGRLTHPIYECFLEASADLLDAGGRTSETEQRTLFAFRRVIAPLMAWTAKREERSRQVGPSGEVHHLDETATELLLRLVGKGLVPDENCIRHLIDNAYGSTPLLEDGRMPSIDLPPTIHFNDYSPKDFIDHFDRQLAAGGLAVYFTGNRHIYALIIGLDVDKSPLPLRLERLGYSPSDGAGSYAYVSRVKRYGRQVKTGGRNATKLRKTAKGFPNGKLRQQAKQRAKDLHQLYETLITPLYLPFQRIYLIPDRSLWGLPWAEFITETPGELNRPSDEKNLRFFIESHCVTQHASLDLWIDGMSYDRSLPEQQNVAGCVSVLTNGEDIRDLLGDTDELCFEYTGDYPRVHTNRKKKLGRLMPDFNLLDAHLRGFQDILRAFEQAETICLLGHTDRRSNYPQYRVGFVTAEAGVVDNARSSGDLLLTQGMIEAMQLRPTRLVLLLSCDGGVGTTITGNAPRALFRAFLHAGAINVVYCGEEIFIDTATDFGKRFLNKRRSGQILGNAYQETLIELLTEKKRDSETWALLHNFGDIKLIGNQTDSLLKDSSR